MSKSAARAAAAPAPEFMARSAAEAARFLRTLGNDHRLMVLCTLAEGEHSVAGLLARIPLSQSALSQHLAILRREGLVQTRREAQTIHYRLADERARRLIPVLYELFCDSG
ncbi:MAG: metalloregulator ArsR/SmtB family transcription factor [Halofilum sp. (in: g-proteobacteria)]|nr:metalloregulator ArsR/SmtB family transcription factor [Halofilum sp. (in: g-proteobacteria)]